VGTLWQDFMGNNDEVIDKWIHYFPEYERHFSPWTGRSVTMLEIGVSKGGSLKMWQRYFGPFSTIIGIDIDPRCSRYEAPGIHVRIGDQSDPKFLQALLDEFGNPDIVLDDGSHHMDHVRQTFEFLYPQLGKDAVYLIEDLHTGYLEEYGGGTTAESNFLIYIRQAIDQMNRHWSREEVPANPIFDDTRGVSIYDSMVVLEKGRPPVLHAAQVGRRPITARLRQRHVL
jgi:hypothetical protein